MKQKIGKYVAETTFPEREKFTAPLVLVPGLWSGSWIWEEMAWYFCQRGWSSWAVDYPKKQTDSDTGNTSLSERLQTVTEVTTGFDAAPILIGFDAGGLFGLLAALDIRPRALVWISPLFPYCWQPNLRPTPPLVRLSALYSLLRNRPHPPPSRSLSLRYLYHSQPEAVRTRIWSSLKPESGLLVRQLTRAKIDLPQVPLPCPLLIISGGDDRLVPAHAAQDLIHSLRADHYTYKNEGHWLLNGPAAKIVVADIHRWLIRGLGESLLIQDDESY